MCMWKALKCTEGSTGANCLIWKTAHRPRNYYRISIICPTLASRILADCHQEDKKLALVGNIFHSKKLSVMKLRRGKKLQTAAFA